MKFKRPAAYPVSWQKAGDILLPFNSNMATTQNQGHQYAAEGGAKIFGTQPLALRHKALVVVWLLASLLRSVSKDGTLGRLEEPEGHPVPL